MKKRFFALVLSALMILSLAACGGKDNPAPPSADPTPDQQSETPAANTEYTTDIQGNPVTITLNDAKDTATVGVAGMNIECKCTVSGETLTLTEKTSGNDQIWERVPKEFTLNADGTAIAVGAVGGGSDIPNELTTEIQGNPVTITLNDAKDTATVGVAGMNIECKCTLDGETLTLTEKTSGNDQIWERVPKVYTVSSDGTAVAVDGVGGEGAEGGETADATELFAWTGGFTELVFNADGTYKFSYAKMGLEESGTWKWENWTLTVTDPNGTEMTGAIDSENNNTLTLHYVAAANDQLADDFTVGSDVWGPALGATGTYAPAE